ncbi:uncharacterized protein IL334_005026 [Kwoniella shivajii]|uniref:SGF29 C-terminal domain-containing protein n=1 Tax=Kwoniella shivajii TaxID=564305 RepID=A0ABZ1D1Z7_9TREE|nr:hypothetical protein IL334_005026 [Kwoniella shivajii]
MSRNRVGSVKASAAEHEQMTSLWHSLIDTLRLLPSLPANPSNLKSNSGLSDSERDRELRSVQIEKRHLDEALDKLNVLLALRRGPNPNLGHGTGASSLTPVPIDIPGVVISNPNGSISSPNINNINSPSNGNNGNVKRKRKLSISASASPIPDYPSPGIPIGGSGGGVIKGSIGMSSSLSSMSMSREATGKQRREQYNDQLPLQPGRKVAFKLPKSSKENDNVPSSTHVPGGGGAGGSSGDDWILATIKRCIQQDKMRYEVQDVDDGNAYNTTLRSIIPLPDPTSSSHLSSHPSNLEDFPKNSQVLALYPDTTSFYRATVISAPIPGTGNGHGIRGGNGKPDPGAIKDSYRLVFVDDDDNIQVVGKDYVLAVSQIPRHVT